MREVQSARTAPQWLHRLFVGYVMLMLLAFLLPLPNSPVAEPQYTDKLVHFGIFLGFALLHHADRRSKPWWTFLLAAAFAGGIELVQAVLPYRDGDWLDFIAGTVGAGVGSILVLMMQLRGGRDDPPRRSEER